MQIVTDSRKVLKEIYNLLNNKSYTLVVNISMNNTAEKLNMSKEHLNLCIHYLIECGYLKGDFIFNRNENSFKEVFVLPPAINMIEDDSL